jgi:glutamate/tyrosine decarboxylase-like PLP-dependent enzyme
MGVVCFRFTGRDGPPGRPFSARPAVAPYHGEQPNEVEVDQFNSDIVERINASGHAYLTQTKLRGRTVMRIGLGNVLTTEQHLRKGWEIIQETADAL